MVTVAHAVDIVSHGKKLFTLKMILYALISTHLKQPAARNGCAYWIATVHSISSAGTRVHTAAPALTPHTYTCTYTHAHTHLDTPSPSVQLCIQYSEVIRRGYNIACMHWYALKF